MFPNLRQRLILLVCCLLGGYGWTWCGPWLRAVDGGSGYSLWFAGRGTITAVGMLLLMGLPILAMGAFANLGGHTLSGMFVVAMGLLFLGGDGGAMDGWLLRANLPEDYRGLIWEAGLWIVMLVVIAMLLQAVRDLTRKKWPVFSASDHYGADMRLGLPLGEAWLAGLVCAVVGGGVSYILIRTSDIGQVIGSLLISFALGGLAAQTLFPKNRNVIVVLVAPLLLAMGIYGYILWGFSRGEQVIAAWYRMKILGPALALPLHYAGAGLAGAILGIGWGQGLQDGATQALSQDASKPTSSDSPPITS